MQFFQREAYHESRWLEFALDSRLAAQLTDLEFTVTADYQACWVSHGYCAPRDIFLAWLCPGS
jgi:hypothetical protein